MMLARLDKPQDYFVYVVAACSEGHDAAPVKVGSTQSLGDRLASLQTGNAAELRVAYFFRFPTREMASAHEKAFHDVMKKKRLKGEWFDIPPSEAVLAMCLNIEASISVLPDLTTYDRSAVLYYTGVWEAKRRAVEERYRLAWESQA